MPKRVQPDPDVVLAFADGSAIGNPGPGGYASIVVAGTSRREESGGFRRTTNNRMELLGAIRALEMLPERRRVLLTLDSIYVIHGISKGWVRKWKANGWRTSQRTAVLNVDLWKRLDVLCAQHQVEFAWVAGHSGHCENERCDTLANAAARNGATAVDDGFENREPPGLFG